MGDLPMWCSVPGAAGCGRLTRQPTLRGKSARRHVYHMYENPTQSSVKIPIQGVSGRGHDLPTMI